MYPRRDAVQRVASTMHVTSRTLVSAMVNERVLVRWWSDGTVESVSIDPAQSVGYLSELATYKR